MLVIDKMTGEQFWAVTYRDNMTINDALEQLGITVDNKTGQLISHNGLPFNARYDNLITDEEFFSLVVKYIKSHPEYKNLVVDKLEPDYAKDGEKKYWVNIKNGKIEIEAIQKYKHRLL